MRGKEINIWRGAARLWIAAVGVAELIAVVLYFQPPSRGTLSGAVRPLPIRGQEDSALEYLAPLVGILLAIALAGYIGWLAVRWIARGFQTDQ